ncbi:hypothetical protein SAMN05443377_11165 [Propionibacterium cyclohexanicum]|uniref:Lipoprotein n=1 Tax=Propionibacterium cyclohexanicum TaxID=64702 RepID=A0A1H9S5R0_9ACTN|nr:hypothetical protein [Propionibacterium cyclohexanicum]SER80310.1 hypothetical protein SAMN05443377_11165 [Propionibacterium cyclohexanicum]
MKPARTIAAVTIGLCAAVSFVGCSSSASTTSGATGTATATATALSQDQCTSDGKVWLVVSTDTGKTLANECVGNPTTGTQALQDANLAIVRDAKGQFICTIGNYPETCPTTFDKFWHYYHATPGGSWEFYQVGSDTSKPAAGSIEGWCYGSDCTPQGAKGISAPSASASASA